MTWGAFLAAKAPLWQGRQTFAIVDPPSSLAPPLRRLAVCFFLRRAASAGPDLCSCCPPRASDSSAAGAGSRAAASIPSSWPLVLPTPPALTHSLYRTVLTHCSDV
ncbi:hypothetical protein TRIATDRAFT_159036 [Trichoderma atroviride IMI 206040]|uniref:Uncharacterized protein n=1 Tax=Hypocrea atroviridis (strain ATCC 20476 / IMI 206040) TaxID=452589 RepID=G9P7H0_HYPAI|nr:uncharacterized protein TRIATDRAFT_159036 [Trichoderma atroviride IMI 206040]EHK42328.1 hypothetical protein TRIATDRAFT_159036 [Trichoderma atroviride IMI 206040]